MTSGHPECLIVGAGVVGLSLAYELSGRGLRVAVLDQGTPGREASWAGAGILPPAGPRSTHHPLDQLRRLSHRLHAEWAEELGELTGIDTGYRRCGGIYLAFTRGETATLISTSDLWRAEGIECQQLDYPRLRELEPALAEAAPPGAAASGWLLPDEAQLRNPDHLRALERACQLRGVRITSTCRTTGLLTAGPRVTGVQTERGPQLADRVCLTAGAWTAQLLERQGLPTGILPIRGQMLLYKLPRPCFARVLNVGTRYLVPRLDGHVLVGSCEEEVGYQKGVTPEVLESLGELAATVVPALAAERPVQSWSGLRPGSFDGFPYLGRVPGLDNAYVAAGHFRSGLHLSPGTARVVAQLMLGQSPEIDLSPFRLGR